MVSLEMRSYPVRLKDTEPLYGVSPRRLAKRAIYDVLNQTDVFFTALDMRARQDVRILQGKGNPKEQMRRQRAQLILDAQMPILVNLSEEEHALVPTVLSYLLFEQDRSRSIRIAGLIRTGHITEADVDEATGRIKVESLNQKEHFQKNPHLLNLASNYCLSEKSKLLQKARETAAPETPEQPVVFDYGIENFYDGGPDDIPLSVPQQKLISEISTTVIEEPKQKPEAPHIVPIFPLPGRNPVSPAEEETYWHQTRLDRFLGFLREKPVGRIALALGAVGLLGAVGVDVAKGTSDQNKQPTIPKTRAHEDESVKPAPQPNIDEAIKKNYAAPSIGERVSPTTVFERAPRLILVPYEAAAIKPEEYLPVQLNLEVIDADDKAITDAEIIGFDNANIRFITDPEGKTTIQGALARSTQTPTETTFLVKLPNGKSYEVLIPVTGGNASFVRRVRLPTFREQPFVTSKRQELKTALFAMRLNDNQIQTAVDIFNEKGPDSAHAIIRIAQAYAQLGYPYPSKQDMQTLLIRYNTLGEEQAKKDQVVKIVDLFVKESVRRFVAQNLEPVYVA